MEINLKPIDISALLRAETKMVNCSIRGQNYRNALVRLIVDDLTRHTLIICRKGQVSQWIGALAQATVSLNEVVTIIYDEVVHMYRDLKWAHDWGRRIIFDEYEGELPKEYKQWTRAIYSLNRWYVHAYRAKLTAPAAPKNISIDELPIIRRIYGPRGFVFTTLPEDACPICLEGAQQRFLVAGCCLCKHIICRNCFYKLADHPCPFCRNADFGKMALNVKLPGDAPNLVDQVTQIITHGKDYCRYLVFTKELEIGFPPILKLPLAQDEDFKSGRTRAVTIIVTADFNPWELNMSHVTDIVSCNVEFDLLNILLKQEITRPIRLWLLSREQAGRQACHSGD